MAKKSSVERTANRPEIKFGPYAGISIAVWLNHIEMDGGPRQMRSITISPRRYRDARTGEWKDAASYRPADIPPLLFGLQKAMEYVYTTPLPEQDDANGEIPY